VARSAVGAYERAGDESVGREAAAEALRVERPRGGRGARGGGGLEEGREGVAVGAPAAGEHGGEEAQRGGRGGGGGDAEVRVREAVVRKGGGGASGVKVEEQHAGGEEQRVHLEDAAREWEVLLEEALEDGVRVRGGALHGAHVLSQKPRRSPPPPPPPRAKARASLPPAASAWRLSRATARGGECAASSGLRSVGPNWLSPPEQLRWTDRTGLMVGPQLAQPTRTAPMGPTEKAAGLHS